MELRHLRYFIVVAEELSFTRAADRLDMAQPPLSQQIRDLEAELGFSLFDRQQRPLKLTAAGHSFLDNVRQIFTQLDRAIQTAKAYADGETGSIRIGFTSTIVHSMLPEVLRSFRRHYPDVQVILQEEDQASQFQNIRDRRTDLSFVYQFSQPVDADDLIIVPLRQEPLVVVLPTGHPLTQSSKLAIADLAHEAFILPLRLNPSGLTEQVYHLCSQAGFVPNIVQEAIGVTILGLVSSGLGISILPKAVQRLRRQGLVYRPLRSPDAIAHLSAIYRRDQTSEILPNFLAIAQQAVANS